MSEHEKIITMETKTIGVLCMALSLTIRGYYLNKKRVGDTLKICTSAIWSLYPMEHFIANQETSNCASFLKEDI